MRTTAFLALLTLLALFAGACGQRDDSWQRVAAAGTLRVGLDPTFPPFEQTDGADMAGLDVDLARALARELGLDVQFVSFGYDGLYDALATNQVDVLISALVIQPERTRDFAYSEPYFNAGEILVVPRNADAIQSMPDLNGRTLAVELGALGHVEATEWAKRLPDLTILPLGSADDAAAAVVDGRADAALVDSVSGRIFLKDHPTLRRVDEPITVEPYALVLRSDDQALLGQLDRALERVAAAGELEQIVARWLGD